MNRAIDFPTLNGWARPITALKGSAARGPGFSLGNEVV